MGKVLCRLIQEGVAEASHMFSEKEGILQTWQVVSPSPSNRSLSQQTKENWNSQNYKDLFKKPEK
jgi:hypothetical protein